MPVEPAAAGSVRVTVWVALCPTMTESVSGKTEAVGLVGRGGFGVWPPEEVPPPPQLLSTNAVVIRRVRLSVDLSMAAT